MAMDFFDSKECEWADLRIRFAGGRLKKITGIEFGVRVDKQHLFAEGDDPIGIQSSNRTPSGTLTVLLGALNDMNNAAVAAGGRDITDVEAEIVLVYQAAKNRPLRTRTLVGAQISEWMESWKQGDPKAEVALPFLYLNVL